MKKFSTAEFREIARRGDHADVIVVRDAAATPREVQSQSRTLRFTFSDGSIDRAGDKINASGWDLKQFMRNPITLWSHDSLAPPIGRASNVGPVSDKLMGDITFAAAETYAFADVIFRLLKEGFINAVSVGFRPTKWDFSRDPARRGGIDFKEQELLEISVCGVPMNANALIAARAKNIDLSDPRLLPLLKPRPQILSGDAARRLRVQEAIEIRRLARSLGE